MIYFRTCAYNAEKTLKRAVDSVLNQTYGEFVYFLLDNGSTDGTGELVREYAQKDKRIVAFYNKQNRNWDENPDFWTLPHKLSEGDYFCVLDADDAYEPTFLEEMLHFLLENHLDIVACGTRFVDAVTGNVYGERTLPQNMILNDAKSFDRYFPEIHWNLRQVWGKLYTARAAHVRYETELPDWFPVAYGGDTVNVYRCVEASKSIGVYAKRLHNYTVSSKSVSHKWIEGREQADVTLFEKAVEVLRQKCGRVSERNLSFLYVVQFNAIKDTFSVLFQSDLTSEQKAILTKQIISHPINANALMGVPEQEREQLLSQLIAVLIEISHNANENVLCNVMEVFSYINKDFVQLITQNGLKWYMRKIPNVIGNVVLGKYKYALEDLMGYLALGQGQQLEPDYPLVLGQVLAALCEEENMYIYFSKKLIQWCLENRMLERAQAELAEWLQLLPEDQDFKALEKDYLSLQ